MAADDVVGSASVEIIPQLDAFERALREGVEGGLTKSRAELRKFDTDFKHLSTTVTKLGKQIRKDLALDKPLKQLDQMGKSTAKLSKEVRNLSIQVSVELTRNVQRLKTEFTGAANEAERMNRAVQAAVKASKDLKGVNLDFNVTGTLDDVKKLSTEIRTSRTEADKLSKSLDGVATSATAATSKVTNLRQELAGAAAEAQALGAALSDVATGDVDRLAAGLATAAGNAGALRSSLAAVTDEAGRARAQMDALAASAAAVPRDISVNVSSSGGGTRTGGAAGGAAKGGSNVGAGILASLVAAQLLRSQTIDQRRTAQTGGGGSGSAAGDVPRGGPVPPTVNPDDLGAIKDLNREMERASILRRNLADQAGEIIDVTEVRQEAEAVADLVDSLADLTRVNFDAAQSSAIKYLNTIVALRNELGEFEHSFEMVRRGMAGFDQQIFDNELDEYAARLTDARKQASAYVATLEGVRTGLASGGASDEFLADLDAQIVAAREAETATMSLEERQTIAAKSAQILAGMEDTLRKQYQGTGTAALSTASGVEVFGVAVDDAATATRRLTGDTGTLDFSAVGEGAKSAWRWVKGLFTDTDSGPLERNLAEIDQLVHDVYEATGLVDFGVFDLTGAAAARESLKDITTELASMEHAERMAVRQAAVLLDNFARMKQSHAPVPLAGGGASERDDAVAARVAINELHKAMVALDEIHGGFARSSNPSLQAMKRFTDEIVRQEDELEGHSLNPALGRTADALRRVHVEAAGAEGSFGGLTGGMSEADYQLEVLSGGLYEYEDALHDISQEFREFESDGLVNAIDGTAESAERAQLYWHGVANQAEFYQNALTDIRNEYNAMNRGLDRIGLEFDGDEVDAFLDRLHSVESAMSDVPRQARDIADDIETAFAEMSDGVFDELLYEVDQLERRRRGLKSEAQDLVGGTRADSRGELSVESVPRLAEISEELATIERRLVGIGGEAGELAEDLDMVHSGGFETLTMSIDDTMERIESLRTGMWALGDEFDMMGEIDQTDKLGAALMQLAREHGKAEMSLARFTAVAEASDGEIIQLQSRVSSLWWELNRLGTTDERELLRGFAGLEDQMADVEVLANQLSRSLLAIHDANREIEAGGSGEGQAEALRAARREAEQLLKVMDKLSLDVATKFGANFLAPSIGDLRSAVSIAAHDQQDVGRAEAADPEGALRRQNVLANELAGRYQKQLDIVEQIDRALNRSGGGAQSPRSISGLQASVPDVEAHNAGVDLASTPESIQRANAALSDLDALLAENAAQMDALRRSAEGLDDELEGHSLTPAVRRLGDALQGTHVDMAGFEGSFGAAESAAGMLDRQLSGLRAELVGIGDAAKDGADLDLLLFQLDELEEKITSFKGSAQGNRPLIGDTNKLLADVYDLGEAIDSVGDTAVVSFKAAGRAAAQLDEAVGPSTDVENAVVLLDKLGLQGSAAGKLLLHAGENFETTEGRVQALAIAMARLVGSRDLLVAAFDRMPSIGGPESLRAYDTFGREIAGQAGQMKRRGVQFGPQDNDPFPDHRGMFASAERFKVPVLSTESTGGHTLLSNIQNDLFRAVHDYFEHFLINADFSRWGEEAAFQIGREQFKTADARRAFASETRGQNAHLIRTGDFPEQKAALLPDHLIGEDRPMAGRGLILPPKTELEVLTAALREQRDVTADESRMIAGLLDILVQLGQATGAEAAYMRAAADATTLATRELGAFERQVNAADDALVGHSLVPSLRELLNLMGDIPGAADRDANAFAMIASEVERLDLVTAEAESELRRLVGIANGGLIDGGDLGLIDVRAAQNALTVVTSLRKGIGGLDTIRMSTLERALAGISDRTNLIRNAMREAFGAMQLGLINADTAIDMVDQSMRGMEASFSSTMVQGSKGAADFVLHLREVQKVAASQLSSLPETDPYADFGGMGVNEVRDEVKSTMLAVLDVKEAARTLPDAFEGEIVDSLRKGIEASTRSALELNLEARQLADEWDRIDNGVMRFNSLATQALGSVGGLLKSIGTASDIAPLASLAEGYRGQAADIEAAIHQILAVYDKLTQSEIKNDLISGMVAGSARQLTESLYELGDAVAQVDYFLEGGSLNPALGRCFELLREVRVEANNSTEALALFGRQIFETNEDIDAMIGKLTRLLHGIDAVQKVALNLTQVGMIPTFSRKWADDIIDVVEAVPELKAATVDEADALQKMLRSIRDGKNYFLEAASAADELKRKTDGAAKAAADLARHDLTGKDVVDIDGKQFLSDRRTGQKINPNMDPSLISNTQDRFMQQFADQADAGAALAEARDQISDLEKLFARYKLAKADHAAALNASATNRYEDVSINTDANKTLRESRELTKQLERAVGDLAAQLDTLTADDLEATLRDAVKLFSRIEDFGEDTIEVGIELMGDRALNDIEEMEYIVGNIYEMLERLQGDELDVLTADDMNKLADYVSDARQLEQIVRNMELSGVVSDSLAQKLFPGQFEAIADEVNRVSEELDTLEETVRQIPDEYVKVLGDEMIDAERAANELGAAIQGMSAGSADGADVQTMTDDLRKLFVQMQETRKEVLDLEKGMARFASGYISKGVMEDFTNQTIDAQKAARGAVIDLKMLAYELLDVEDNGTEAAATLRRLATEIVGADEHLEKHSLNPNLRKLIGLLKDVTVAPITKLAAAFRSADAASTALVAPGGGGKGKGFAPMFDDFDERAKNFKRKSGDVKSQLRNMVQGAAAGLGFQQVGKFLLDTVNEVSAVAEAGNRVTVVFGDAAQSVKEFATGSVQAMGQSTKQVLDATGTFGNLFTGLGVNKELAADLSKNMVTLASDIASFADIPIDDAFDKFRSGLSGEFEPLKRIGVGINEVTLEQEALNLGFKKSGGVLDPTIKALATYNLILKRTTNAQGDFKNTQESLANQQRILTAEWQEAKLEIGQALLPTALALTKAIRENIPALKEAAKTVANFAAVFVTTLIPAMTGAVSVLNLLLNGLEMLGPAGTYALVAFAGFLKLNSILGTTRKEAAALTYQMKTLKAGEKIDPSNFGWVTQQRLKLEEYAKTKQQFASTQRAAATAADAENKVNAAAGITLSKTATAQVGALDKQAAAASRSAKAAKTASSAISGIGSALPIVGAAVIFLAEAWGTYQTKVNAMTAGAQDLIPAIIADNKALVEQGQILDANNTKFGDAVKNAAEMALTKDLKEGGGEITKELGAVQKRIDELNSTRLEPDKIKSALDLWWGASNNDADAMNNLLLVLSELDKAKISVESGDASLFGGGPEQVTDIKQKEELLRLVKEQGKETKLLEQGEVRLNDGRLVTLDRNSKVIDKAQELNTQYQIAQGLINDQIRLNGDEKAKKEELLRVAREAGIGQDALNEAMRGGADANSLYGLTAEELKKRLTGVAGAQLLLQGQLTKFAELATNYKEKLKGVAGALDVSGKAAERAKARQDALGKSYDAQKTALEAQKTALGEAKTAAEAAIDAQIAAVQKLNEEETARVDALKEQEQAAREVFSTFVGQIDAFSGVISEASGKAGERLTKLNDDAQKAIDDLQKQLDTTADPTLIDSLNKQLDAAKANLEGLPDTAEASLQDLNDVITSNLTSTAEFVSNINVLLARGADDLAKFLLSQGKDAAAALREAVNLNDGALSEQERFIESAKATNAAQKSEVEAMVDYLDGVTVPDLNLIPEPDKASLSKSFENQIAGIDRLIAALEAQSAAAQAAAGTTTPDDYLASLDEQNQATAQYLSNLKLLRRNNLDNLLNFYVQQGSAGAEALNALVTQNQAELNAGTAKTEGQLGEQDRLAGELINKYDTLIKDAENFAVQFAAAGAHAGEAFKLDLIESLGVDEINELISKLVESTKLTTDEVRREILQASGLDLTGVDSKEIDMVINWTFGGDMSKVFDDIKRRGLEATQGLFRPYMGADGGFYNKPTNMIIGEAGPEVLLPLSNPQRALELSKASGLFGVLAKATGFGSRMGADGAMVGAAPGGIEQTNITIEQLIVQVSVPPGTTDPAAFGTAAAQGTVNRLKAIAAIRAS